jgi:cell division septation protein DedD
MKKIVALLVLVNIAYFLWQTRTQQNPSQAFVSTLATPSLVLLDESSQALERSHPESTDSTTPLPTDTVTPAPDLASAPTQIPKGVCVALNGFDDQAASEKAIEFLSKQKITAKLVVVETQGDGDYLVYLPPFESRDAALKKLRELKAQAIDSFIIGDGERINGISLGVFSKEESAKKMQSSLKSKGYSASLIKGTRTYKTYTLRVAEQSVELLTEVLVADLSKNYVGGKLVQSAVPCQ